MKEVATIKFIDGETKEEALVIIRSAENRVCLCLSHVSGSDTEVCMTTEEVRQLIEALQRVHNAILPLMAK